MKKRRKSNSFWSCDSLLIRLHFVRDDRPEQTVDGSWAGDAGHRSTVGNSHRSPTVQLRAL
jgi:hypothetical protein